MKPLLPALTLVCACLAMTRAAATPTASSSVPTAAADAQTWTLAGSEALPAAAEGLAHHRQTLEAANGAKATLHVLSFDASRYTFRVLDQEPAGQSSLEEILRRNHCLAGTNGGYFRPDFDPVGLLICDGRSVEPLTRSRLLTGVLVVTRNHHIALRRLNRPLHEKHAREALQSGPFLVENGHEVDGLNATHTAQRVAVCTDGWKRWGLVVSSDLTLAEFGAVLANPALLPGGLRINAALNLDGGHSTAMWSAQPGREPFYLHEGGSVRDFLGIAPREPAH